MRRFFLKLIRRRRLQQDLEAELALHQELSAAHANTIPLGNKARIAEQMRDLWRFNFLENLWRDIAFGIRGLRRSPALVLSAVISLALGVGANMMIFSLGMEFLLSEPSVADASSVVNVSLGGGSHSRHEVVEFLRRSGVFADVVGENAETFVNWNDGNQTRRIFSVFATKNYFTGLGIPVAFGRGILPGDPDEVVVLQHEFWRRHFNADPAVVGRGMVLDGRTYTIVGILTSSHRTLLGFGFSPDVYLPRYPETMTGETDRIPLAIYARLKPEMTLDQAKAGLQLVGAQLDRELPLGIGRNGPLKYANSVTVSPLAGLARLHQEPQFRTIGLFFLMLLAVAGLVLLIACVNVAGLLLARASARRREIAIRLAIGAGRGRLLQQLLVESLLLSLLGAACGLVLAQTITTLIAGIHLPLPLPLRLHVEPDWRFGLYAALLTTVSTLACGLLPAVQSVRESLAAGLHRQGRLRLRRTLVAGQIAVALIVLTTGFLFVRNLARARAIGPGFDVVRTLRADVYLPPAVYDSQARTRIYVEQAMSALETLPGIEALAAARIIPFTDFMRYSGELILQDTGEQRQATFNWNAVTPDYFRAMDIPLRQGRAFLPADRGGSAKVVIVNEAFVQGYLQGRSPLGRSFLWERQGPYQVVGVVEGTQNITIGEGDLPQLYEPLSQIDNDRTRIQFVLRSTTPPAAQLDAVRKSLREVDPAAGIEVEPLHSSIGLAFLPSQVGAVLAGSVGLLGLLLATVGLYGTMVYSVTRRTQEIGVRMAVGATRRDISRMIVMESAKLIAAGSAVGILVTAFITQPLATFLAPGLNPADPISFLSVLLVLALTGLAACWGPVRRAISIDPISCLRHE